MAVEVHLYPRGIAPIVAPTDLKLALARLSDILAAHPQADWASLVEHGIQVASAERIYGRIVVQNDFV